MILVFTGIIYGLSSLLTRYEGPFGVFERLRHVKPLENVLRCSVCTSVWVAFPFIVLWPLEALAGLGFAILLLELTND